MLPALSLKRRRAHQAAAWFARLNRTVVDRSDLDAFRTWRTKPGADEAFRQVEGAWRRLGPLQADPEVQGVIARGPELSFGQGKGSLRWGLALGAGAIAAAGSIAIVVWMAGVGQGERYVTPVGGRRAATLADGSRLLLDADTQLRVRLTDRDREVILDRGRLLAEVAHDATRPFVVVAGATSVVAVGTAFTVRREGSGAQVVLLRGHVDVRQGSGAGGKVRLSPGEGLKGPAGEPVRIDPAVAVAWTEGRIILDQASPADAVAEINRYTPRPLHLGQGLASTAPVSGVFLAGDPDAFVAALTRLRGWRALPQADGSQLLVGGSPPASAKSSPAT